jgi:Mg2+/Co2+ transporter CorB
MMSDLFMWFRTERVLLWRRLLPTVIGILATRDIKRMVFEGKRNGE